MRKTKIVCTIGPASTDEKIITDMCKAGMNVAQSQFFTWHTRRTAEKN